MAACGVALVAQEGKPGVGGGQVFVFGGRGEGDGVLQGAVLRGEAVGVLACIPGACAVVSH